MIRQAVEHFKRVLRLDPDHGEAAEKVRAVRAVQRLKTEGNTALQAGDHCTAQQRYQQALAVDRENRVVAAKLEYNLALVADRQNLPQPCIVHCTAALERDHSHLKARLRRAKTHRELGNLEAAIGKRRFNTARDQENRSQLSLHCSSLFHQRC